MKSFFPFFLFLTICLLSGYTFPQSSSFNQNFNPSSPQNDPEAIWDVQLNVNVTGSGAVKDGTFFYVTDQSSNLIRAYNTSGNLIYSFAIPGVTGLGDITFDGTFEYGGTGGNTIYEMSFQSQTLISTISTPVSVRHIAYDSQNDAFWIGGWSDPITLVTRNGIVLNTINLQLSPVTGTAYDGVSTGGPYLWLFVGGTPDSLMIYQYHIPSGTLTGVTHDVLSDVGSGVTGPLPGGLFFMNGFITNTASLGGVLIGSPTKLFVYEIYNAVPVELSSFTAQQAAKGVELNWTTATETNNRGFEIQRSENREQRSEVRGQAAGQGSSAGIDKWETIGFVDGYGTTTEPKVYRFTDNNVKTGTYSYRLKQTDFDGSYKYSDVISIGVNTGLEYALMQNYPNPFNPATQIKFTIPKSGLVTLKVYDLLGRKAAVLVNEERVAGEYSVKFDGSNLASGVYYYQLKSGNYSAIRKMLLIK